MTDEPSEKEWLERRCVRIWKEHSREAGNFLGTGSLISARHIVTAAHVFRNAGDHPLLVTGRAWASERTIRVGPIYAERGTAREARRDVAVVGLTEADQTNQTPLPLADSEFLRETQDQAVTIGGFAQPFGEGLKTVEFGKENYHDPTDSIVVSGALEHGMSGGPVVRQGRLVGVVFATSPEKHKTYFVPLSAIQDFLKPYVAADSPRAARKDIFRLTAGEAKKWARYVDRTDQITDMARFLGAEWLTSRFGEGGFTGRDDGCHLMEIL